VKLLDLQVYIFTVFGQQRHKLVDYDSGDQRVVCRRAVDLLALSLDLAKFLMKRLGPISEPLSARWETSIEHGVVPPRGSTILSLLIRLPQAIMLVSWRMVSFPSCLVSFTSQPSCSGDLYFGLSSDLLYGLIDGGSPYPTMKISHLLSESDSDNDL
jgi:hypothetical protein